MPFPLEPNSILQVTFKGTVDDQTCLSVFHYQYTGLTVIVDGEAAIAAINGALQDPTGLYKRYLDAVAGTWQNGRIRYQKIYPTRYRAIEYIPAVTEGQGPATSLPPANAVAITKRSNIADRHGLGTLHMPAVPSSWVQNGVVQSTPSVNYANVGSAMVQTILVATGQPFAPIMFNRANPAGSFFASTYAVQQSVRTMKRRVVGRGI